MNILYLLLTVFFLGYPCHCAKSPNPRKRVNQKNNGKIIRIIGGELITNPVPYQVSLQKIYPIINQWKHICGGSIISKNHILTAAHCTDKLRPEELSAVVGTSNLKKGGLRHFAQSYVQHELYSSKGSATYNDVSVLKVSVPFQFNEKTAPISLAEKFGRRMENSYPVTLTGWGVTDMLSQIHIPDSLMILNYTTISNEECQMRGFKVSSNEICAYYGRRRSACLGDSGGPLVNRERNIQIGIVSYGSGICATGKPDVYVRVSKFVPWIEKAVTNIIP